MPKKSNLDMAIKRPLLIGMRPGKNLVIALFMLHRSVKSRISTVQYRSFYGNFKIFGQFQNFIKFVIFSKKAEGSAGPNPRPIGDFLKKILKFQNGRKFQNDHKMINMAPLKPAISPIDRAWIGLSQGFFPASYRLINVVLWPCRESKISAHKI